VNNQYSPDQPRSSVSMTCWIQMRHWLRITSPWQRMPWWEAVRWMPRFWHRHSLLAESGCYTCHSRSTDHTTATTNHSTFPQM